MKATVSVLLSGGREEPRVIIYKHIEHWDLIGEALTADDALSPRWRGGQEEPAGLLGLLGAALRRPRGTDRDLREDRHRERQLRLRHFIRTIVILLAAGLIV
jgi:uncharacterized membrane protein YccC